MTARICIKKHAAVKVLLVISYETERIPEITKTIYS